MQIIKIINANEVPENTQVEVTTTKPQILQVMENGMKVQKTMEIIQPSMRTSLKSIDMEISNIQKQIDHWTAELNDKQALRSQVSAMVSPMNPPEKLKV